MARRDIRRLWKRLSVLEAVMAKSDSPIDHSVECANYLKALADPVRLQIVRALQSGPMSVSDLSMLLDMEMANVSHHLRVMYHADLVGTERDGKYIYYHLNKEFLKSSTAAKSLDFGCCKIDLRN